MGIKSLGAVAVACDTADCDASKTITHPLNKADVADQALARSGWTITDDNVLCPVHSGTHVRFFAAIVPLAEQPGDRCYWTIPGSECDHLQGGVDRDDVWGHNVLYQGDAACRHRVVSSPGGGVKCVKCPGWFCF